MPKYKELKVTVRIGADTLLRAAGQGAQGKAEPKPKPEAVKRDD